MILDLLATKLVHLILELLINLIDLVIDKLPI